MTITEPSTADLRAVADHLKGDADATRAEIATLAERAGDPGVDKRVGNLRLHLAKVDPAAREAADAVKRAERADLLGRYRSGQVATLAGEQTADGAPQFMRRVDPWSEAHPLRDRAMAAVDTHARSMPTLDGDKIGRLIDSENSAAATETARYVTVTGSPAYRSAFAEWLRHPERPLWTDAEVAAFREADSLRAAMSLTTANGGAMVPYILDPSVMLSNNGTINPIRQLARVETIAGATEFRGVTSAGVSAEWLAEGAEAADASPTFAQPAIPTYRASSYVFGSYEILADAGFESQLMTVFADAKDRLEGTAFATGNGTTQPEGLVTGLVAAGSTVNTITTDTFAVGDVYALQNAIPARFRRGNSSFLAALPILNRIRQFDTTGGSSLWATLGSAGPANLLGDPIFECSDLDGTINALADNYIMVAGDVRQAYTVVDRLGLTLVVDNMVLGANRRPTGQAGFFAYWRSGAEVTVAAAARVLNCT
jgi:HK97 family phage major capsid protein